MKVPTRNAFGMNRLGLGGQPFPFSVSCHQPNLDIWTLKLCPQRVRDISDLLMEEYATTQIVVFNVGHSDFCDAETHKALSISEVATELDVVHQTIEPDLIVVSIEEFYQLLQEFEHFNLVAFGIATESASEDDIIERYLELLEREQRQDVERSILSTSHVLELYLQSHDDCYLYVVNFS